jgi:hypothetical protein
MTTQSFALANRMADEIHAWLEPGGQHHNALSDLVTAITADAMRSLGVPQGDPRTGGGFDQSACELFGDDQHVVDAVAVEIVEHCFKAARAYLEHELEPRRTVLQ